MYLIYYWLYFLSTFLLQIEYDQWNYHHYTIICRNTQSCKVACSIIQGCATNKNYYYINVICIQIVPHWGTNQEYGTNRGNTVIEMFHPVFTTSVVAMALLLVQMILQCSYDTGRVWLGIFSINQPPHYSYQNRTRPYRLTPDFRPLFHAVESTAVLCVMSLLCLLSVAILSLWIFILKRRSWGICCHWNSTRAIVKHWG